MPSIKKHVRHMTKAEMNYLLSKARAAQDVKATRYSFERIKQRGGSMDDVLHALHTGYLIEYHKKGSNNRILVRGTKRYGQDVMCVVLDIESNELVTAYWNRYNDNHYTLNESAYNRYVDVLKELGA